MKCPCSLSPFHCASQPFSGINKPLLHTSLQSKELIFHHVALWYHWSQFSRIWVELHRGCKCCERSWYGIHLQCVAVCLFCLWSWEGHFLRVSYSDFHLIIFCFAPRSTVFRWRSQSFCHLLEFPADSFDHSLFPDSPLLVLPSSLCLSPLPLSPPVSINTPLLSFLKTWFLLI